MAGSCPKIVIFICVSIALCEFTILNFRTCVFVLDDDLTNSGTVIFFTSTMDTAPRYYPLFQFIGFVICIIWIYAQCNESKLSYFVANIILCSFQSSTFSQLWEYFGIFQIQ